MKAATVNRCSTITALVVGALLTNAASASIGQEFLAFSRGLSPITYALAEVNRELDCDCSAPAVQPTMSVVPLGEVLFESPQGFWLAPSRHSGELYGPSTMFANWHFTQWLNPGPDFPAFTSHAAVTSSGRVTDLGGQWEIAQNGRNLPPGDEFCVFAEANQSHVYPDYRPAGGRSRPLSEMEYLHHTIGFMSKYEQVGEVRGITQAAFLTAVVLQNIDSGDKFYYQLELRPVAKAPIDGWWHGWTGPLWGYGDTILNYGKPIPPVGVRAFYHLDLLPRLSEIIQNAYNWLDTDMSHWIVIGTYHGSHVWGDIRVTSVWDSFSLHARYKDS